MAPKAHTGATERGGESKHEKERERDRGGGWECNKLTLVPYPPLSKSQVSKTQLEVVSLQSGSIQADILVRAPMEEEDPPAEGGGAGSKGEGGGEQSRSAFARWAVGCGGCCGCRQLVELVAKSASLQ